MSEEEALKSISDALTLSVGSDCVARLMAPSAKGNARKLAAARSLGTGGRGVRIELQAWGPAFEQRTISKSITIDLKAGRLELVTSVLEQCDLLISSQMRTRVRAAALGISEPLGREAFMDLGRLRIDIAAAETLGRLYGSEDGARDWLKQELGLCWDRGKRPSQRPLIHLHGLTIAIPFQLSPLELADPSPQHRCGRPLWLDDEIRIARIRGATDADMANTASTVLQASPLANRAVIAECAWPPRGRSDAFRPLIQKIADAHGLRADDLEPAKEWRLQVEPLRVSTAEAFD